MIKDLIDQLEDEEVKEALTEYMEANQAGFELTQRLFILIREECTKKVPSLSLIHKVCNDIIQ